MKPTWSEAIVYRPKTSAERVWGRPTLLRRRCPSVTAGPPAAYGGLYQRQGSRFLDINLRNAGRYGAEILYPQRGCLPGNYTSGIRWVKESFGAVGCLISIAVNTALNLTHPLC